MLDAPSRSVLARPGTCDPPVASLWKGRCHAFLVRGGEAEQPPQHQSKVASAAPHPAAVDVPYDFRLAAGQLTFRRAWNNEQGLSRCAYF